MHTSHPKSNWNFREGVSCQGRRHLRAARLTTSASPNRLPDNLIGPSPIAIQVERVNTKALIDSDDHNILRFLQETSKTPTLDQTGRSWDLGHRDLETCIWGLSSDSVGIWSSYCGAIWRVWHPGHCKSSTLLLSLKFHHSWNRHWSSDSAIDPTYNRRVLWSRENRPSAATSLLVDNPRE